MELRHLVPFLLLIGLAALWGSLMLMDTIARVIERPPRSISWHEWLTGLMAVVLLTASAAGQRFLDPGYAGAAVCFFALTNTIGIGSYFKGNNRRIAPFSIFRLLMNAGARVGLASALLFGFGTVWGALVGIPLAILCLATTWRKDAENVLKWNFGMWHVPYIVREFVQFVVETGSYLAAILFLIP